MNFKHLMNKLDSLDQTESNQCEGCEETDCSECGENAMQDPQDDVGMNISISGSGENGIRELIAMMNNFEKGDPMNTEPNKVAITPVEEIEEPESENSENSRVFDITDVIPTGTDHSSNLGDHRPRKMDMPVARPSSDLIKKLNEQYKRIKSR